MIRGVLLFGFVITGCWGCGTNVAHDTWSPPNADAGLADVVADLAPSAAAPTSTTPTNALVAARPYHFKVPARYDARTATPLIVMLHGWSANSLVQEEWFQLAPLADQYNFLYAYPDGTTDLADQEFWNADDACCNFFNSPVDDVAYLKAVISDVRAQFNVDAKRIYFIGHSNGAFMTHRMACEDASEIAAVVAIAGDVWKDATKCVPSEPVNVLQVHGDADTTIYYDGGNVGVPGMGDYPAAHASIGTWASAFCPATLLQNYGSPLDLVDTPGAETTTARYEGCATDIELWTMANTNHWPPLNPGTTERWVQYLFAHPKN